MVTLSKALDVIKSNGFAPWDSGTFAAIVSGMFGFNLSITQVGSLALMLALGCGAGAASQNISATAAAGTVGGAGVNGGFGGGGGGAGYANTGWIQMPKGSMGCPYSGGSGAGGITNSSTLGWGVINPGSCGHFKYSARGGAGGGVWSSIPPYAGENGPGGVGGAGGAGNPAGSSSQHTTAASDGTGGKLTIICRGLITVQAGGKIEANGMPGGGGGSASGGGGSGGGHISLISPNAISNAGTIQAIGGTGGYNGPYSSGGNGGAGSVVTKSFSDMGW
jgi:hypothetical protein